MYNRVRSYTDSKPEHSSWVRTSMITHSGPDGCADIPPTRSDLSIDVTVPYQSEGIISDLVVPKDRRSLKARSHLTSVPRLVKPVHHTYRKFHPVKDDHYFEFNAPDSGSPCVTSYQVTEQCNPGAYSYSRFAGWLDYLKSATPANLDGKSFASPDWFSVVDSFNEAVDQLVPGSFFSGETTFEGGIFIDAIKFVLSPKKRVLGLLKDIDRKGLKRLSIRDAGVALKREMSGKTWDITPARLERLKDYDLLRIAGKETINADLLYEFGVRPAIQDLGLTFASHDSVVRRLSFLNANRGRYVPIRVRKTYPNSFDPSHTPTPFHDMVIQQVSENSVAAVFGMGRVRTDINDASKWRAYAEYFGLNKVVGTAWELIPFSFVVDWFTNAQERINDLTRVRLGDGPFLNLTSIGSSIKKIASFQAILTEGYDLSNGTTLGVVGQVIPAVNIDVVDYTRMPGIPDTSGVVDVSALGLLHYIKLSELLIQRIL